MSHNRLRNIDLHSRSRRRKPVIVSVLSGKGGVGKSVIAYNLGALAAQKGVSTLLIDADWYFGDQHILANVVPKLTLYDVISSERKISEATIDLQPNFQLIASPASGGDNNKVSIDAIDQFLGRLKTGFYHDIIILDSPSGSIELIQSLANISDLNLAIITPELTSIADGYGLFKYLSGKDDKSLCYLFVNRAENRSDSAFIYQKFTVLAQKFLNRLPLSAGYLMDDRQIIDATNRQKPVCELYENSKAANSLSILLNLLTAFGNSRNRQQTDSIKENSNPVTALADIEE